MTPEQITVPKQTWDALVAAVSFMRKQVKEWEQGDAALTAAKAVSHQKPETTPAPEGGAITAENDHIEVPLGMVQPLGWYCVSRDGLATQCADQRDAEMTANSANRDWPNSAPYRAVQLCEYTHPQASEPAAPEAK